MSAFGRIDPRHGILWQLGMTALFNTAIALLLTLLMEPHRFWQMFAYSQAIGLSIHGSIAALSLWRGEPRCPTLRDLFIGMVAGALLGSLVGGLITGTLEELLAQGVRGLGTNLLLGLTFGAAISYFFINTLRMAGVRAALQEERLKAMEAEKALTETRLRLLQAQIEPHFLFNTLSNVHSLIETHPDRAARMLEALTRYLRASLRRTRTAAATLDDELDLVRSYLEIQRERLRERLHFSLHLPGEGGSEPFPPMLIQPLVENAVRHGIEPSVAGGEVTVRVERRAEGLRVEVADTGIGWSASGPDSAGGVGLANVRERLAALYGERGRLVVEENFPSGVRAILQLAPPSPSTRQPMGGRADAAEGMPLGEESR